MDAASAHLARLGAHGRPAGSPAAAEARAYCAGVLANAGFVITKESFEYSDVAGTLAAPAAGVAASLAGIGLYLGRRAPPLTVAALAVLLLAGGLLGYISRGGVLDFPIRRRQGVNLQAVRSDGREPAVWLIAHIDSKWQPVSMIARVLGVIGTAIGLAGLLVLTLTPRGTHEGFAALLLLLTWLGSSPLMLSIVGSKNDGTLDNASGVAAVLEAAESIAATANVGVLITDAEELALAGARAWVRGRRPGVAINCDSIDDVGRLTIMHSRSKPGGVIDAVRRVAEGEPLRVIRLIPGVLTDHVPLAEAGWQTVTLSRGGLRTLARVHTSRDTLAAMSGTGIAGAAALLARIATELS